MSERRAVRTKNINEWAPLSDLLSNLIVKYADVLDIDSLPDPNMPFEDDGTADSIKKRNREILANDDIA